jgi:hypothetical protein
MAIDNTPRFSKPMKKTSPLTSPEPYKEYIIVERNKAKELQHAVNEYLNKGWDLHGDTTIVKNEYSQMLYVQPMTRSTFEKPEELDTDNMWPKPERQIEDQNKLTESLENAEKEVIKLQKGREITKKTFTPRI